MQSMSDAQNSAENSAKRRRGNPTKIKPFRWPKGVSGNPGGRPHKKPITEFYAAFANVQVSELPARIRKKDCDDLNLAAAGALGLFVAMGEVATRRQRNCARESKANSPKRSLIETLSSDCRLHEHDWRMRRACKRDTEP
jgi:hypothetical protein